MRIPYLVFFARNSDSEQCLGVAGSLRECRRMAAEHHRGELPGVPKTGYGQFPILASALSALVGSGRNGPSSPAETVKDAVAVAWFGVGGSYCAVPASTPHPALERFSFLDLSARSRQVRGTGAASAPRAARRGQ